MNTPSAIETPAMLAEMLHPGVVAPRHEGFVWRKWTERARFT